VASQGWIKLHRKIRESDIWLDDEPFDRRSAWIDLLLSANHEDRKVILGSHTEMVKRGSFITSIRKLCKRWKWSNTKVINYLNLLKNEQMIDYKSDTKKTLVTIENYSVYQDVNDTKTPLKNQQSDTEATPKHTNKNEKNDIRMIKNEEEEREPSSASYEFSKVIQNFNQNIHLITPIEAEKLKSWLDSMDADVIISAISEAVNYSKRSLSYINAVLNSWQKLNIKTKEQLEAYLRDRADQKGKDKAQGKQFKAKVTTFNSYDQRAYDMKELEKKLVANYHGDYPEDGG
jgi:DnaD/phage-associated family protein